VNVKPSSKRPVQDDSPPPDVLQLRLYVAGRSPNSVRALANLRAMCGEWLADDDWQLEVVDVFADPMRAVEDKILVTPTLLRLTPPVVQIVGDLSQRETVVSALDLAGRAG
jgi:circadian clock protein KaiB